MDENELKQMAEQIKAAVITQLEKSGREIAAATLDAFADAIRNHVTITQHSDNLASDVFREGAEKMREAIVAAARLAAQQWREGGA